MPPRPPPPRTAVACPSKLAVAIVSYTLVIFAFSHYFSLADHRQLPTCATSRYHQRPGSVLGPPVQFVVRRLLFHPEAGLASPRARSRKFRRERVERTNAHVRHLAQSGGTTLRLAFRAWTKAANITLTETGQSPDFYQSTAKRSHKIYGVFTGHRGFGFSWKLPSTMMKIVILRDPISRLVSKFEHVLLFCARRCRVLPRAAARGRATPS